MSSVCNALILLRTIFFQATLFGKTPVCIYSISTWETEYLFKMRNISGKNPSFLAGLSEKFRNNNRKIVIIIIISVFQIEINVSCHTAHIGSVFVSQE